MVDREDQIDVENSPSTVEPFSSANGGDIAETDVAGSGNIQTAEDVSEENLLVSPEDAGNASEKNNQMLLDNDAAVDKDIRFKLPNSSLGKHIP